MLSAAQKQARLRGIGSSEIAAIVGEDPMKSALDVYLVKTGRVPDETSEQAELGHDLEPVIAARFARKHGVKLESPTGTFQHPEHEIVLATIDRRIAGCGPVVECKNVGYRMMHKWRSPLGNGYCVPDNVRIQANWQCAVVRAREYWVAALIGGRDYFFELHEADPDLQQGLIECAWAFWDNHVLADIAPPPDHTEKTTRLLTRMYEGSRGKRVDPTDEIRKLAAQYAIARRDETIAKRARGLAGNGLRALLGDAELTTGPWGSVAWATQRGRVNWQAVAKAAGASDALAEANRGKPERKLTVRLYGEEEEEVEGDDGL
jgi:putative phage-type endonuclease